MYAIGYGTLFKCCWNVWFIRNKPLIITALLGIALGIYFVSSRSADCFILLEELKLFRQEKLLLLYKVMFLFLCNFALLYSAPSSPNFPHVSFPKLETQWNNLFQNEYNFQMTIAVKIQPYSYFLQRSSPVDFLCDWLLLYVQLYLFFYPWDVLLHISKRHSTSSSNGT